jgi:hypothetical protein
MGHRRQESVQPLVPRPQPGYIYVSNPQRFGGFLNRPLMNIVSRPSGAGFAATFPLGLGGGISLTYQYGVTDLGSGFLFYEPFSYDICLADLTGLIADMVGQCITDDGIDLGFVPLSWEDVVPFSPSLKFYGFHD